MRGAPISLINHLRWLAAAAVCLTHARIELFPMAADAGQLGLWGSIFYGATMFGPEAVIVFFVLSGYLIGGRLWTEIGEGRFDARDYSIARATRLYVTLIPALALTLALGKCDQSGATILGNLLLLQNVAVAPLCNNPALWSLSSEAVFYVLAPFAIAAIVSRSPTGIAACLTALLAMAVISTPDARNLGFGAAAWAAGALAARGPTLRLAYTLPSLIAALLLSRANILPHQLVGLAIVAIAASAVVGSRSTELAPRFARAGADMSFSLYLVHMPVIVALAVFIGPLDHNKVGDIATFAGANIVCVIAALTVYWLAERHTRSVREWLTASLHSRRRRTQAQSFR